MSAEASTSTTTTNTVSTRPTIRVQHSGGSNEGQKANEDPQPGNTTTASTRSKVGLQRPNNKRNPEQFSLFRAASPITTGSGSGTDQGGHLYLALPSASKRSTGGRSLSAASLYNENGVTSGLTDEKLLIKSFEVLANAIGFKKSFSTSDILGIEASQPAPFLPNRCHSDVHLSEAAILFRLEASSRSLSTWVAVGDTSATTQLPSPQARGGSATPNFTPADLVRSVNKRIRQTYLKKRLLTTYKALERMSQSGFNLEKLKDVVKEGELAAHPELIRLLSNSSSVATTCKAHKQAATATELASASSISQLGVTSTTCRGPSSSAATATSASDKNSEEKSEKKVVTLSSKDIERDRGKPLSKFDRNVMIFDWLHTLDENATIEIP